jgi:hypothetical protein
MSNHSGVFMKALLISLFMLTAVSTQAQTQLAAHLSLANLTRNMTAINPQFRSPAAAQIIFDEQTAELTVNRSMPPCAPGMMCIQVMPAPLAIHLEVVQIVKNGCSVKYIAATPANVKTNVYEEVTIEDFTNSPCEMVLSSMGTVSYKVTGVSSLSQHPETATANFVVQGDFLKDLNSFSNGSTGSTNLQGF